MQKGNALWPVQAVPSPPHALWDKHVIPILSKTKHRKLVI